MEIGYKYPAQMNQPNMPEMKEAEDVNITTSSYRRILSSTSILGGAAAVNILIGMVRSKFVAVYLGTEGMGTMGMYMSLSTLIISVAAFGLNVSGVRELSVARGVGDVRGFRDVRLVFRRLSWGLGLLGTLGMALAAAPLSRLTFQSSDQTGGVMWLSLTVLLALMGNYFTGLVQVAGRLTKLGLIQVVGAIAGAVVSILCFVVLREDGIVPALVLGALVQLLASAFWSRGLGLPETGVNTRWSRNVARSLLTLGGVSVLVGLQASLVGLLMRRIILSARDLEAVGLFQAAQALSGLYATYILGAMASDFLPRLTAAMSDRAAGTRLLNEQTTVALLLGLPGVLVTIVFAPLLVPFFYSQEFGDAVPVLQVMSVAVFGRLLAWPLGMALIAVNARRHWVAGEFVCSLVQVLSAWLLMPAWGVMGAAFSQVAVSLVCCTLYYAWVRNLTGLRWSSDVLLFSIAGVVFCGLALGLAYTVPGWSGFAAGCLLLVVASLYCLKRLVSAAGVNRVGIANRLLSFRTAVLARFSGRAREDR